MGNNRTCENCNVSVHRVSMQKLLRSKKILENIIQNDEILPELLIKEEQSPIKNKFKKYINLKQ